MGVPRLSAEPAAASASGAAPEPAGRALAWGRLLRLSLAPSAVADPLAGLVLATAGAPPLTRAEPWLLVLAALAVYHGAMALNDWADRAHDARTRPDRPIPSGAVSAAAALTAAIALTALGVAAAALAAPVLGAWIAALAALAWAYDLVGRGSWSGPLLLGACRAGNVGAGILLARVLAAGPPPPGAPQAIPALAPALWLAPLAYGLYVVVVSRLGRLEDGEDARIGTRPRRLLALAAALLLVPAALPVAASLAGRGAAAALGLAAAIGLARRARAVERWDAAAVGASMGLALRRLLVFTAALAVLSGTPAAFAVALAILAGYPLAHALRRVFPPS